jgi:hypothetical protein
MAHEEASDTLITQDSLRGTVPITAIFRDETSSALGQALVDRPRLQSRVKARVAPWSLRRLPACVGSLKVGYGEGHSFKPYRRPDYAPGYTRCWPPHRSCLVR